MPFDINRVRAQYPALQEGFAHFDGAAGTLVAARASDAITAVTRGAVANKSTAHAAGRRALEIADQAREAVADLVGGQPEGVVFGQSATALTYLVSRTLADGWGPGDEIVVSRLDHDANVRPWVQVATRTGATVRWAEFDPETGVLPAEEYEELVNERTKLVAVTAASNAIGTRPDVAAIARVAHEAGALIYVDGVHATPHLPTDVAELGADFYVTSAYKWSGPHLAACVAAPASWQRLAPDKLIPSPDAVPERYEFGTQSFELLAGVTGAVEHLAALSDGAGADSSGTGSRRSRLTSSLTEAHTYEMGLFATLVEGLGEIPGVMLCPAPAHRCPTVAFRVGDQHPARTAELLGDEGICVFSGDYYAYEYFQIMGLRDSGGAVRASVYHYTTAEDIARLLDAVKRSR
jgi:cysteine desulfurase family protein (TIGR01976 family)